MQQSSAPLVRLDNVSKTYRNGSVETCVLAGINFEILPEETISLTGTSGSGKSTLVSLLAGLLLPESGDIFFEGHAFSDLDDVGRARLRAARIGVVLQSGNLIPFLSASENVKLAIELAGGRRATSKARQLLADFGLGDRLDHLPNRMSGGETQRASVAMALANEPDLLLADEITGELDSANAEQIMQLLFDAQRDRGLTILYVTHSKELAGRAHRQFRLRERELSSA